MGLDSGEFLGEGQGLSKPSFYDKSKKLTGKVQQFIPQKFAATLWHSC